MRRTMRPILIALVLASTAAAQPRASEYVLSDGRKVGISEWSDMLAAVPCEVQANYKAKATAPKTAPKCAVCGAGCDCDGTCVCDREAARRASRVERPRQVEASPPPVVSSELPSARIARLRALSVWVRMPGYQPYWSTVGGWLDAGYDPAVISPSTLTADDVEFLKLVRAGGYYQGVRYEPMPVSMPVTVQAPTVYYTTAPAYYGGDCANGQCGAPSGGGFSAGFGWRWR